jgi:hypothetical protein
VQHAQVRGVADPVDEPVQQRPRQPFQRIVAQVRGAEFERGDAEAVAPVLRQMRDETGIREFGEQVVDGRAGQLQLGRDRRRRHRTRVAGQQSQHGQPPAQCRYRAVRVHRGHLVSYFRQRSFDSPDRDRAGKIHACSVVR